MIPQRCHWGELYPEAKQLRAQSYLALNSRRAAV